MKTKTSILILFLLLSFGLKAQEQHGSLKDLEWILGTWIRQNAKAGELQQERWWRISDREFRGMGMVTRDSDTVFVEKLGILLEDGSLYYVADVPENPTPVYFKFTSQGKQAFVSENPLHDAPKRIAYELEGKVMTARVSWDGGGFEAVFKKEEENALRVISYNIWNGFEWGKDSVRKANCIAWIKSQEPDVLALQELCGYTEEQLRKEALQWGHEHVQLLKTEGYPTALTSKRPIHLKERVVEPFWHGLLHCETYGIDFYVVHLSPSDCNIRLAEARMITEKIREESDKPYIILGDFNAYSPFDGSWLEENMALRNRTRQQSSEEHSNLRLGEFDYSVISEFLALPAVDVFLGRMDLQKAFTFPTAALIGKFNQTDQTVVQYRVRIDHILVSPDIALDCTFAKVFNQQETQLLSDHFPVMAEFKIKN